MFWGAVENGSRDVYSVQHEGKFVLNFKRKIIFQDRAKTNKKACHNTYKKKTYDIPLYMTSPGTLKPYACKLELNGISCTMEINTECSSSLINEKQFNELPNARLTKKKKKKWS